MKQKNINRRSFVKSATISTGALLTTPFSLEAMANNSNSRKLKLAVVGCGGRGTGAVVQALRADKDVELVAMADAFGDRVENSLKYITEELDGGPIISQEIVEIDFDETERSLAKKVLNKEHILYPKVIHWYTQDKLKILSNNTVIVNGNIL